MDQGSHWGWEWTPACKIFGWVRSGGHKIRLQQGRWFPCDRVAVSQVATTKMPPMAPTQGVWAAHFPLCFLPLVKWLGAPATPTASALLCFTLLRLALCCFCFLPELPCGPRRRSPCRVWWVTTTPKKEPKKKSLSTQVKSLLVATDLLELRGRKGPLTHYIPNLYCSLVSHTIPSAHTSCLLNY